MMSKDIYAITALWWLLKSFFLFTSAERFIVEVTQEAVRLRHPTGQGPIQM
jgi:hypothetical protein